MSAPLPPVTLGELIKAYPGWNLFHDQESGSYVAIRKPTPTAREVLVAPTLARLAEKLAAEAHR